MNKLVSCEASRGWVINFWFPSTQRPQSDGLRINSSVRHASRRTAAKRHSIITRLCMRGGPYVPCAGKVLAHSVPEISIWEMCTAVLRTTFVISILHQSCQLLTATNGLVYILNPAQVRLNSTRVHELRCHWHWSFVTCYSQSFL